MKRYEQNSFYRIHANGTTVVQSTGNAGILAGLSIGIAGSSGSFITLQNSGGTVISKINASNQHFRINDLGLAYSDGLTIITSGTTAPDFTIIFR